ncbi:DEAD/DEAH box helicase [Salegentibacter salarius]|uniref:DEAD/DEAH box helicase n=1 Tax=Salegentibacter salarius TaxID=435906 RepID=A0A2N0U5Y1_9FLAO|nr:DEAD/DEAH box helicase [Salegentibacter salarius]OEY74077.1 DEAD/DEAH box helicase [Salegentibacter salarius]PKD22278.1 DEAD/DEAH box helicase [Salegentibacter salarius]SLJ86050.1 ATP-dependent RNA helicase RhlE [Salegentibacter salarius]
MTFQDLNITTPLRNALEDIGINTPTPIQEESFSTIMSGKDMVGIAQTGTGKTFAYMLPILRMLKYSEQKNPRVLVLVPTRELVVQVVEEIEKLTAYMNVRIAGIYGGVNMNTQHQSLLQGQDIVVATPGRLYDLVLRRALQLKSIQKLVIDEVDVMLDLGFKFQINNIFELLPQNRQNIMFSATITENVENLIEANFKSPQTISVAASGTPLDNIKQTGYRIPNFYTKVNLLRHILADKETYSKVLIFVAYKRMADRLYAELEQYFQDECTVIHSNKTQNYRLRSIKQFGSGFCRILVATDVMARGLDIESVSHVINFDTPKYPENYMHRIGRTGRAEKEGNSILMTTEAELEYLERIEALMKMEVPQEELPAEIEISSELIPEEQPKVFEINNPGKNKDENAPGPAFHEKKEKNRKENLGGSYRREIAKKYKKPKTRGDKNANRRKKK